MKGEAVKRNEWMGVVKEEVEEAAESVIDEKVSEALRAMEIKCDERLPGGMVLMYEAPGKMSLRIGCDRAKPRNGIDEIRRDLWISIVGKVSLALKYPDRFPVRKVMSDEDGDRAEADAFVDLNAFFFLSAYESWKVSPYNYCYMKDLAEELAEEAEKEGLEMTQFIALTIEQMYYLILFDAHPEKHRLVGEILPEIRYLYEVIKSYDGGDETHEKLRAAVRNFLNIQDFRQSSV